MATLTAEVHQVEGRSFRLRIGLGGHFVALVEILAIHAELLVSGGVALQGLAWREDRRRAQTNLLLQLDQLFQILVQVDIIDAVTEYGWLVLVVVGRILLTAVLEGEAGWSRLFDRGDGGRLAKTVLGSPALVVLLLFPETVA